uniref:Fimbrial protein n=1 Tax=Macrostomum lignano TaxID=282301 RepID=A0A1I8IC00_9PLAT
MYFCFRLVIIFLYILSPILVPVQVQAQDLSFAVH